MSCCHLSGSCLGCNRWKRTHLLTSGSPCPCQLQSTRLGVGASRGSTSSWPGWSTTPQSVPKTPHYKWSSTDRRYSTNICNIAWSINLSQLSYIFRCIEQSNDWENPKPSLNLHTNPWKTFPPSRYQIAHCHLVISASTKGSPDPRGPRVAVLSSAGSSVAPCCPNHQEVLYKGFTDRLSWGNSPSRWREMKNN